MGIPLLIHILIHVFFAFLAGFIIFLIWKKPVASFLAVLISGVVVDFDHFIDYFLAFGWSFNLYYFIKGFEFLKTDKMYTVLHGWEYVAILALIAVVLKNKTGKTVFFALALGLFFHLSTDVVVDKIPIKSYSMLYKINNDFEIEKLVTPEHFEKHEKKKIKVKFE